MKTNYILIIIILSACTNTQPPSSIDAYTTLACNQVNDHCTETTQGPGCCLGLSCEGGPAQGGTLTGCVAPNCVQVTTCYQKCNTLNKPFPYFKTRNGLIFVTENASSTWCTNNISTNCKSLNTLCNSRFDCCENFICSRSNQCIEKQKLDIGEPCDTNQDCLSNICIGWCSNSCSNDNDCKSNKNNYCINTPLIGQICMPECNDETDCSIYGPGVICHRLISINNTSAFICLGRS